MKKLIASKDRGIVATAVNSLVQSPATLKNKLNTALQKNIKTTKSLRPGVGAGVDDIKKKYGWTWKRSLKTLSITGVALLIGLVVFGVVGVAFAVDAYQKAPVINQTALQAKQSSIVYFKDGTTEWFRLYSTENRKNVDLAQIPQSVQYAVIGLEEKNFYKQDLPWLSLLRAVQDCAVSKITGNGGTCAGASGLAQQLYRNVTGDKLSNIQRKIRELFAAKKLLDNNTKDEILELYLNWVPYGKNIAGVQVAAETYFGKNIPDVTIPQACLIASMPQNPANFENAIYARDNVESPSYIFWKLLQERKNICLDNLLAHDIKNDGKRIIESQEQLDLLKQEDLGFIERKDARKYPHLQEYVQKELSRIFPEAKDLTEGGYKIITSIDPVIQDKLDVVYDSQANRDRLTNGGVNNGAAVILDGPTGNVVAMRGSMDYNNTDIDGQVNIVDSFQQPGSTMKLYDYVAALEQGFNPSTVLLDAKTDFGGGYAPHNYFGGGEGLVTMAYAFQNSLNISAVKSVYLAQGGGGGPDGTAGMSNVTGLAERMGVKFIDTGDDCRIYVSTSLGACDMNMLSHATGFNTVAQNGNLKTSKPFLSITREPRKAKTDADKEIAQQEADADNQRIATTMAEVYPQKDAVVNPAIARQAQSILSDRSLIAYGSASRYLTLPGWEGRIAAKTGTSTGGDNNYVSDMWTAGFSTKYTVLNWAGNTRNELVANGLVGIYVTAPTWQEVMAFLHEGMDPNAAEMQFSTEGLKRVNVGCPEGVKGGARCANELMTDDQATIWANAQKNISSGTYNVFEKNIFENRAEAFTFRRFVSKFDRKLVDKDKFPAEYIEEVNCTVVPSAFPASPNWRAPANGYTGSLTNKCNERSTIDPNAIGVDVAVTPGLANGQALNAPITITAKGRLENQGIKRIEFKVDGSVVDSVDGNSLTVNPAAYGLSGSKFVVVRVVDSFDKAYETNYSGIIFQDLPEFSSADYGGLSGIDCDPAGVGEFNCSFVLPSTRKWTQGNNLKMTIGSGTIGATCTYQLVDKKFMCNDVPRNPPVLPGTIKLKGPGDGNFISTGTIH